MNVLGFLIGVRFGLNGVAWALLISVSVGTPIHFALVKRALDYSVARLLFLAVRSLLVAIVVAGAFMVGSGSWREPPDPTRVVIGLGVAVLTHLLFLWRSQPDIVRAVVKRSRPHVTTNAPNDVGQGDRSSVDA